MYVCMYVAQAYGLPFLHPYFGGGIDVDFRHGVNFAMSSSAVIPDYAASPFYLQRQFNHFKKFKSHYVQQQSKGIIMSVYIDSIMT